MKNKLRAFSIMVFALGFLVSASAVPAHQISDVRGTTDMDTSTDSESLTDTSRYDSPTDQPGDHTDEDTSTGSDEDSGYNTGDDSDDSGSTTDDGYNTGGDSDDSGSTTDDGYNTGEDSDDSSSTTDDGYNTGGDSDDSGSTTDESNELPSVTVSLETSDPKTGDAVEFSADASDPDGSVDSVEWSNGDTGSSTTETYSSAGDYTMSATVTDNDGATVSDSVSFTVDQKQETDDGGNGGGQSDTNEPPSVSMSFEPSSPETGETVSFSADASDSDGSVDSVEWDLDGDGSFDDASGSSASRSYSSAGSYDVAVKATDNDGAKAQDSDTVDVSEPSDGDQNQPPEITTSHSPQNPSPGTTVDFTADASDRDGSVESVEWDLDGDGSFDDATGTSASRSYGSAGQYGYSVRATDDDGATSTASGTVNVQSGDGDSNQPPSIDISYSPQNPRTGETVSFTASVSDADGSVDSVEWDLDGDGSFDDASGNTASERYSSSGSYTVSARAMDDEGASSEDSVSVDVERRSSGGSDDEDDSDDGGGGGTTVIDIDDDYEPEPEPSMTASISSTNVEYGEQVVVSGELHDVDSSRTVDLYYADERVGSAATQGLFDISFTANKLGSNEVRVESGDLQKSFELNVESMVSISGLNTKIYLRPSERHQVCVEVVGPEAAQVTLYEDGDNQGTKSATGVVCFDQIAPASEGVVKYRAVAEAGSATDVEEKTVSVVSEEEESTTPTGGFFNDPSSLLGILLALLAVTSYYYRERIVEKISELKPF